MPTPDPHATDAAFDVNAALKTALDHHQQGRRDEAEALYRQVLTADPDQGAALYLFGLLQSEAGRPDEAEQLLLRVTALRPDHADSQAALADAINAQGRQDEAITRYRRALAIQPGHPGALKALAGLLFQRGFANEADIDGAIEVCRAAIALLPHPAGAHAVLGRLLLSEGRMGEAAEAFGAALALAPDNLSAQVGQAQALVGAGRGQAALTAADAALALAPHDHDAWLARGQALMALRRAGEAVDAFEQAARFGPDRARTLTSLGNAYAEVDRPADALAALTRALELDPGASAVHANLGSVLYRGGDLDSAERHLLQAVALDPRLMVAHQNLAGVYGDRGDEARSRRHRDLAYGISNVFVEAAPNPKARVLALTTADSGNVPHRFLLPTDRYTRIDWFIEYATPRQAEQLPDYDVVFNIIGDPDYSEGADAAVEAFVERCDRRVLNKPARIGPTRRDRLPGLLAGIDNLLVPQVARFDAQTMAATGLAAAVEAAGLSAPMLIRPIGSHGGKGLVVVHSPAELADIDVSGGAYATEFVDFRGGDDGYRKYRMIFVDRTPYPYHLAIGDHWLVHYVSAGMGGNAARQAEELRFLDDPRAALGDAAMDAVAAIGKRLDLDYAGIDFSILPDGRVLVFEANATMLVHPEAPDGELAHKNPYIDRITSAFQALVDRRAR